MRVLVGWAVGLFYAALRLFGRTCPVCGEWVPWSLWSRSYGGCRACENEEIAEWRRVVGR